MATRRAQAAIEEDMDERLQVFGEPPHAAYDPANVGEEELSDDLALQSTLTQIGESGVEAKVIVYKINENTKKDTYLYDCSVTEFATGGLSEIQASYGAGDYRIRVFAGSKVITHRRLTVGAPRIAPKVQEAPPVGDMMAGMMQTMMMGFKELAVSLKPAPVAQSGLGIKEVIELMAIMRPAESSRARDVDPLDMLQKIISIQKDIAPAVNSDGEVGGGMLMLKALDMFGKPLMEGLAAQQSRGQVPQYIQQPVLSAPVAPIAENPAQPIQPEQTPMNALQMKVAALKIPLLTMARSDADPSPYASMVIDFLEPAELAEYIIADDWWVKLCALLPEASSFAPWFNEMRASVLEQLQPEQNTGSLSETQTP